MERAFVQLPNGDLWKGRPLDPTDYAPDNVDVSAPATPEDAVMEMITKQKGETIHCIWCGQDFQRKNLDQIREHVETRHPTAIKPIQDIDALAAEQFDPSRAKVALKVEAPAIE